MGKTTKPKAKPKPKKSRKGVGGRPSKFEQSKETISILARKGFADLEMAQVLKISEQTLNNWKKKSPEFFESLNDWKKQADHEVVRSLYERACGYSHPETKVFNSGGEIVTYEVTRHYPPDPTSMIFWLKNRDRENWRDKIEHGVDGEIKHNHDMSPALRETLDRIYKKK